MSDGEVLVDRTGWQYLLPLSSDGSIGIVGKLENDDFRALAERTTNLRVFKNGSDLRNNKGERFDAVIIGSGGDAGDVIDASVWLRPGGILWINSSTNRLAKAMRRQRFGPMFTFAKLPNPDRLRLLVPVSEGGKVVRTALQMHAGGTRVTRLKSLLFGLGAFRLTLFGIGPHTAMLGFAPGGRIESLWSVSAPSANLAIDTVPAVLSASPSSGRKAIIGAFSRSGSARYFTKVTDSPHDYGHIERETKILSELSRRYSKTGLKVPAILNQGSYGESRFLTLGPIDMSHPPKYDSMPAELIVSIAEIFNINKTHNSIGSTNLWHRLLEANRSDVLVRKVFKSIGPIEELSEIPIGLAHRDFVFWNISVDSNTVSILDWEWAESSHIPLQDLYHYYLHGAVNAMESTPMEQALRIFFRSPSKIVAPIKRYMNATGVQHSHSWKLFVLYLSDWILLQHEIGNSDTHQVKGYRLLLDKILSDDSLSEDHWLAGALKN